MIRRQATKTFWRGALQSMATCLLVIGRCGAAEPAPFHIQAHRGAGIARPENTLESFEWSWKRYVTPESDLRTTKDGVIVCFHDSDLRRVVSDVNEAQAKRGIEDLTLEETQQLEVGSFRGKEFAGQRVPALESVFEQMHGRPERMLYLDVKTVDLDSLAALVYRHGVAEQVLLATPDHELVRKWKKRVPESFTLLWNGGSEAELSKKLAKLRQADFAGITHLQIHVRVGEAKSDEPFSPSGDFLRSIGEELQARNIVFQVLPWECSELWAYERLLALGADSFATDYPEVTLRAVRSFRARDVNAKAP